VAIVSPILSAATELRLALGYYQVIPTGFQFGELRSLKNAKRKSVRKKNNEPQMHTYEH